MVLDDDDLHSLDGGKRQSDSTVCSVASPTAGHTSEQMDGQMSEAYVSFIGVLSKLAIQLKVVTFIQFPSSFSAECFGEMRGHMQNAKLRSAGLKTNLVVVPTTRMGPTCGNPLTVVPSRKFSHPKIPA